MSQFAATFTKTLRCFLRTRAILLWTLAWPIFLLIIVTSTALATYSGSTLSLAKGSITISMVAFSLMLAGFANLSSSIARDRETGLLAKLRSMPISPLSDFVGRMAALAVFSLLAALLVAAAGVALGARFTGNAISGLSAAGFLLLVIASAAGIGLIIGSLVRSLQGTAFIGIGLTIVTLYITGIFIPYESLPSFLQAVARVYPISSATASVTYLLLGWDAAGYNPLTLEQVATTLALSFALLAVGTVFYSRLISRRA